jgi:hypothetical protein
MNHPGVLETGVSSLPHGSLEQRVQRLEEAVVALQDTHWIEERILERLREQTPPQVKAGSVPAAAEPITEHTPMTEHPLAEPPPPAPAPAPLSSLGEFQAMVRMFFDIHYHVAWTTRILVLIFIPLILTSQLWFPPAWVPGIGFLFDKIFDVLLAFLLYKVLAAEARRYVRTQSATVV